MNRPRVSFLDVGRINARHRTAIFEATQRVIDSGWYVRGREVEQFEQAWATYCGVRHAVGVASGFDALHLILRGYREMGRLADGDEVIVAANTYIASILAITENNLVPVLVEPDPRTFNLDPTQIGDCITPRTRAVMAVHLYGRIATSPELCDAAQRQGLILIEDAAQAHGATLNGTRAGGFGGAAGFSFYPGKNLGALGDAGGVTTDDEMLADVVRTLANYGSREKYLNIYRGINSRLDEMQAAVLGAKLPFLDSENAARRDIATRYLAAIVSPAIALPEAGPAESNVWHVFVIRSPVRDSLQLWLKSCGISTHIHYPVPPHRQAAYQEWKDRSYPITELIHNEVLSLPMDPTLTEAEVGAVIEACNSFPGLD